MNKRLKVIIITICSIIVVSLISIFTILSFFPYGYDYKFESTTIQPYTEKIDARPLHIGVDIPAGEYELCARFKSFFYYYTVYDAEKYELYLSDGYYDYIVPEGEVGNVFEFECVNLNLEDNHILIVKKSSMKPVPYFLKKVE